MYAKSREDVMQALNLCVKLDVSICMECPYFNEDSCLHCLHSDVLELLNNQNKMIDEAYDNGWSEGYNEHRIDMEEDL